MLGSFAPWCLVSLFLLFFGGDTTSSGSPSKALGKMGCMYDDDDGYSPECVEGVLGCPGEEGAGPSPTLSCSEAASSGVAAMDVPNASMRRLILFFFSFSTSLNLLYSSFSICNKECTGIKHA